MQQSEFELFCEWASAALAKHQAHAAFQNALRALLAAEFPGSTAVAEVYAVAGGRNDMVQYWQDGKRAVFELFCSPSQIPQDLRLLERAEAHWKTAVLLDEAVNPDLSATFFRKKPEGLPFLWLSQVIMPAKATECRLKLRQLLSMEPLHPARSAHVTDQTSFVQIAHADDGFIAQTGRGDININQKKIIRPQIIHEPGDVSEEAVHAIQELIRQLAETDEQAGKTASYGEYHQRLKRRYKVASYRKLTVAQGEDAIGWLREELGRKLPSLRRSNHDEWRKRVYRAIWACAREMGWEEGRVHGFANAELGLKQPISSLKELGEQKLELLRDKLRNLARRNR
ncbi:MAG: hypothetical protein HS113_18375 [Verrucomicrobiales bacterium]|nr:hypothetical protein [Verrucomicrobiales bacterium]